MLKKRSFLLAVLLLTIGLFLAACGSSDDKEGDNTQGNDNQGTEQTNENGTENEGEKAADFKVAMVTDVGGVDDKSFNQSAWEGLKAFGAENGLTEGEGFTYAQSENDADYMPNLTRLVRDGYNLVFGIGFMLHDAVDTVAKQNPDTQLAIVDDVVDRPNVASITFKEHEGSFLVGVVAGLKTKTNKIGFVGGVKSPLIQKFEAGFRAGVKAVNPDAHVTVQYAESFGDAAKGKLIASSMYNAGIDVIYHAAGATGNGVFAEAKDRKNNDPDGDYWVIGVDRDQYEEGALPNGDNVTLTSMVKRVDVAVQDIATKAMNGEFPGGENVQYGLEDNGIAVAETNKEALTDDILQKVKEFEEKIKNGELTVPEKPEDLQQ
jgi:basic membrane protein A and related proteins